MRKVYFKGNEYVFCGEEGAKRGPIATQEQYENGDISFAMLYEDGNIIRYGEKIGTVDELVFGDVVHVKPKNEAYPHVINQITDLLSGC